MGEGYITMELFPSKISDCLFRPVSQPQALENDASNHGAIQRNRQGILELRNHSLGFQWTCLHAKRSGRRLRKKPGPKQALIICVQFCVPQNVPSFSMFMPSPQPEAPKAINVYASFPIVVVPGVNLDLRAVNWKWIHCLHLLLTTFNALNLSRRPYRWILYAIGVVVGAQGYISLLYPPYVELDFTGPLTESGDLYYFITNAEKQRMFPIDTDIGRARVTSSVHIAREGQFHDGVADRDVRSCVLADMWEGNCDAVHLLPHSKGHEVCYSYSQFALAHHRNVGSTYQFLLAAAVGIPPKL